MSNPSKRKGTAHETNTRDYFQDLGLDCTRLAQNGSIDIGDLALRVHLKHYVIECKAEKSIDLAGWVTEAAIEADNYATLNRLDRSLVVPVVVAKRRMAGIDRAYVIQELGWWVDDHR